MTKTLDTDSPEQAVQTCPICHGTTLTDEGEILHHKPARVAGVEIDLGETRYHMIRCDQCSFAFKAPTIPTERLMACYAQAKADHWGHQVDTHYRRYDTLKATIEAHCSGGRILDVGCFTGTLLNYMGNGWDCFGVEPSALAADVATARGIQIIGDTIEDIPSSIELFDVIVSIDVLEHLPDPLDHVRKIASLLKPGGIFMAMTGDTGTWPWRLIGSRYWYVSLPEHISFYNQKSMQELSRTLDMKSVAHQHASHIRAKFPHWISQLTKNLLYFTAVKAHKITRDPLSAVAAKRSAPDWLSARDHMIHVMQKPV